jgi:hypothetical protein
MQSFFSRVCRLTVLKSFFLDVLTWQITPQIYYTEYFDFCKGYLYLVHFLQEKG